MTPLGVAFKEWAVICGALATGRQAIILRKGGIAEVGGTFRPEHDRFWLYPTYFHEHRSGVTPDLLPLLDAAEAEKPPAGSVKLTHFAQVTAVHHIDNLEVALRLAPFHGWTEEVIRQRFHYRTPGLYVLVARVHAMPSPQAIPERPEYAGCKTWVPFEPPITTEGSVPVIDAATFETQVRRINSLLSQ